MNDKTRILIVDDDQEIRSLLAEFLQPYGFDVITAHDGVEMFSLLDAHTIDLIILDVLLPGDDGITLCKKIRSISNLPIIMLTAIGSDTDRIIGLEIGADDYIAKPFNPRELLARIKAILRRIQDNNQKQSTRNNFQFDGWKVDTNKRALISPDELEITLSAGEYDLLIAFLENPNQVLSRDHLLDITKNRSAGPFDRSIDVQISRLRYKIEQDPKTPTLIKTVRGGGYFFTPEVKNV